MGLCTYSFLLWVLLTDRSHWKSSCLESSLGGGLCLLLQISGLQPWKDWMILKKSGYIPRLSWGSYLGNHQSQCGNSQAYCFSPYQSPSCNRPLPRGFKDKDGPGAAGNSITLTPGTIAVALEDNEYTVHCLDRRFGEGLADSSFVRLLHKIEGQVAQ